MKPLAASAFLAFLVAASASSLAQTAAGAACPPGKHRQPAGEDTRSTTSTDNGGQAHTRRQPTDVDSSSTTSTANGGQATSRRHPVDQDSSSTTSTVNGGQATTAQSCQ